MVCMSKGCKITGHQTLRKLQPRANSNPSRLVWVGLGQLADFSLRLPNLKSCNFAALYSTDPKFSAFTNVKPFKDFVTISKGQQHFRGAYALSKRSCFNSTYLVKMPILNRIAVGTLVLRQLLIPWN